ncbi:MAG: M15 family metallopeptidase [Tissierellia bacterium]|nr:M15 family metallopeptidase [Tissierellia bacterium]
MSNYGIRELKRQQKKRKKKILKRRILKAVGVLALIFAFLGLRSKDDEIVIEKPIDKRISQASIREDVDFTSTSNTYTSVASERGFEDLNIDAELKVENNEFSDQLVGYIITKTTMDCYLKPDEDSKVYQTVDENEYLQYYGSENNYAKVKIKDQFYYVKNFGLSKLEDSNELKVIGGILVVNDKYSMPDDFNPEVDPMAKSALNAMISDMKRNDLNINIASDVRSYDLEKKLFDKEDVDSEQAGHSEHQTGLAFDLYTKGDKYSDQFRQTKEYNWLKNNSYKYGFIERYPEDKQKITGHKPLCWHFRFVGVENAIEMYENDLCLEEYLKIN